MRSPYEHSLADTIFAHDVCGMACPLPLAHLVMVGLCLNGVEDGFSQSRVEECLCMTDVREEGATEHGMTDTPLALLESDRSEKIRMNAAHNPHK
jgi:hypothetical protein